MQLNSYLVAAALVLFVQMAVFLLAGRVARTTKENGSRTGGGATEHVEGDIVVCPECETHNELEYRFCAECAAELPGSVSVQWRSGTPSSRGTS